MLPPAELPSRILGAHRPPLSDSVTGIRLESVMVISPSDGRRGFRPTCDITMMLRAPVDARPNVISVSGERVAYFRGYENRSYRSHLPSASASISERSSSGRIFNGTGGIGSCRKCYDALPSLGRQDPQFNCELQTCLVLPRRRRRAANWCVRSTALPLPRSKNAVKVFTASMALGEEGERHCRTASQ